MEYWATDMEQYGLVIAQCIIMIAQKPWWWYESNNSKQENVIGK